MPPLQRPAQLAGGPAALSRRGPAGPPRRSPADRLAVQYPPLLSGCLPVGELRGAESANNPAIVEVENLAKRYRKGKTNAGDGISFSGRKGEVFAFPCPNGAGKTTTISVLTTTPMP